MLQAASDIIGAQPVLAIFLALGLGSLVGQISISGFSLGVGAVLFVGIAIGAFAPKAQIIGPIAIVGLIMFLWGIGVLYGRQFFDGMTGPAGRKYNFLAFIGVMAGLAAALALGKAFAIPLGPTLGLFAGAMTSTSTLQAAMDALHSKGPSTGYAIGYPIGVIGPILCYYFMTRVVKPTFPPPEKKFFVREVTLSKLVQGKPLSVVEALLPPGVKITMVRDEGHNVPPSPDLVLDPHDGLMLSADSEAALQEAADVLGTVDYGHLSKDRSEYDYLSVFVGKGALVGIPLADLPMPEGFETRILHVRRYDVDLQPSPDLKLEFGDQLGLVAPPGQRDAVRKYFGDSLKSTAEFSYVSLGIGVALGVLLGIIPIPIPGVGTVSLGVVGGPLIVALIVGKLRRTGPLLWTMPLPANIALRNFGLAVFLAAVGINAGQPFVSSIASQGAALVGAGVIVLLTTTLIVLLVGHYIMKIPYDDLLGLTTGSLGNPAILSYACRVAPTERPDICYAMIFPSMTIVKVVAVQVVGLILGGGAP